jgi:hypothetical protein
VNAFSANGVLAGIQDSQHRLTDPHFEDKLLRTQLPSARRILVKVGTSVVAEKDRSPSLSRIAHIVESLVNLRNQGKEVILVSSGAVGLGSKALLELEESRIEKRLHKKVNNKVSAIKMGRDTFITRIEAALRCAVPYIPYCAPTKFRLPDCDFTADWKECNKEKGCRWHEEKTKCVAVLGWGPFGDETVRDHPKQYLEESVNPEIVNVFRPEDCFRVKRHHECNSHRVCRWVIDEYRNHEEYHHCIALPEGPDVIPIERDCSMIFDITSCSDNTLCEWDEIEMFCVVREVPIRTVPRKGKGEKTVSKL